MEKEKFSLEDYIKRGLCNMEEVYNELSTKEAVQAFCLQCGGFDFKNSYKCDIKTCPLRVLNNKWQKSCIKKTISEEHKAKLLAGLKHI